MAENWLKVVLYRLNCDHPSHDHIAYARKCSSDPDADEFLSQDWETVWDARRGARVAGWAVKADGTATCPMCLERK
jgi:hypothetical protein